MNVSVKSAVKILKAFPIVGALCMTSAYAGENPGAALGVVAAASIQNPVIDNGNNVSGATAWGLGVNGEIDVGQGLGVEADLTYLRHKFSSASTDLFGGATANYSSGYIHIPVLLRYHPIPLINVGAGVYYSRVIQGWSASTSNGAATSVSYGDNDWGFELAAGTIIPLGDALGLTVDLRYARSLTDSGRSSNDPLKFSDFMILAGIRFGTN